MSDKTLLGLWILALAAALGLLADGLLNVAPWGVNLPLWTSITIIAALALARWRGIPLTGGGRWLLLPAAAVAGVVALRDSPALNAVNLLVALGLLAVAALRGRQGRLLAAGVIDLALAPIVGGLYAAFGVLGLLVAGIEWRGLPRAGAHRSALAVLRGLALALPPLLIFGGLFAAADAGFADLVSRLFIWDLETLFQHAVVIGVVAWGVAGLLFLALHAPPAVLETRLPTPVRLGPIEFAIVLGALDLLFLTFVLLQLPYLFGGAALVQGTASLTYAEYARRGFFELTLVAALALPLLLTLDWLAAPEVGARPWLMRGLSGLLVALLFVVMASAMQRMLLYQAEYGLTELRLYTSAFMGWIALLLLWYCATVLRGARPAFAAGVIASGLLVVVALDLLNPHALIASVNLQRLERGHPLDTRYLASLSADAVPALIEALPRLPPPAAQAVARHVRTHWSMTEPVDWRAWNLARATARGLVDAHQAQLAALDRPPAAQPARP